MIHENIELTGSFTVSGSFVLPSHASSSAVYETGSMYHDTVDGVLKVYTGTQWVTVGEQTASAATGPASANIEYLVVAGGAGSNGGGGGAGGLLSSSLDSVLSGSSFTITVGAGGANSGGNGDDTQVEEASITTIIAVGGGYGANYNGDAGGNGGSGGGGSYGYSGQKSAGSGTVGQGNDGGTATTSAGGGAGGGGAGEPGANQSTRKGGDGLQSNITGTPTYYAGGGGGGKTTSSGGLGGGGAGSLNTATAGSPNTGGGGGGSWNTSGAAGGSGVAIFAYDSGSINTTGGIVGAAGNGRKYNQFNQSGTFIVGSTSDFQIITNNIVSHFDAGDFASRGTSTWTDLSGNGNNLTAYSSPSLGSNFYYDFATSYFSKSDTAHDFVDGNFTIEAWVKWDSLSSGDTIASKRGTGSPGTRNWLFGHDTAGLVYFIQYHNSSNFTYPQTSSGVITTGTWYHMTATGDSSNLKIYVNASEEASTSFTATGQYHSGTPLEIGRRGTNSGHKYLDGQVAQFRAYSSALTAAQVLQNYNATKTNFIS